ncbi:hypothetical protein CFOL_v3_07029 [Cephalotus follicularis]|uniref:HTH three-helical bundle domain-containing protein n=1 Tax=Cephalotus follicularis TaxID=3775 RepID=A0A1Q3B666_CEPFO|nr:hypothetical protein CFOL_v3_07029 [Cephalotus follicularis]
MLRDISEGERESLSSSLVSSAGSKSKSKASSSSCSVVTSDGSFQRIQTRKLSIFAVVARCHEMKLKVVRKSRSKACFSSGHRKTFSVKPEKACSGSISTEARSSSCLSSSSSARSGRRRKLVGSNVSGSGSANMRRRAEAILKFLSRGSSSEVQIRQVIGDSPDTSKALRMLLKLEEVKRSGTGGRNDPYVYMIASRN